jgi:hypothetical protein
VEVCIINVQIGDKVMTVAASIFWLFVLFRALVGTFFLEGAQFEVTSPTRVQASKSS